MCGRPGTQAAHVFRRWCLRLRWMPANGLYLCDGHAAWSHDREDEFDAWARGQVGARVYDRMGRIYRGPLGSRVDMATAIRQLRRAIAAVQDGRTPDTGLTPRHP